MLKNQLYKVWCLSLESNTDRRKWMLSIKNKIGLDFEFWNATTPTEITDDIKERYFKYVDFYEWDVIVDAVMATFISHMNILKWSVDNKTNVILIEDDLDEERYLPKKKTTSPKKKTTVEETYDLWKQNNSIAEIASIRVLTKQTIYGHFVKLIQSEKVAIEEIIPSDKLDELAAAFKGYKDESLNALMENYGDSFSWEEARMFKASLNIQ